MSTCRLFALYVSSPLSHCCCILTDSALQALTPPVVRSPAPKNNEAVSSEMYQQDGDYIKDIEINDLRNRYTLTKGAVQKRVNYFCHSPLIV
jgi:hypothetical protein